MEIPAGYNRTVIARVPEASDVASLKVGDMAPDCFGGLREVVTIDYRGEDITGRPFVAYTLKFHENSTVSGSMKANALQLAVDLTGIMDGYECLVLEREMNGGIPQCHCTSIVFRGEHAVTCPCYK